MTTNKPGSVNQQPVEGEEIMVNTPYDVFTLPLQPSGLSSGPRFVVHVPGPEQPAAPDVDALVEVLEDIRSLSSINLAMPPNPFVLTAMLGDIHQIADAAIEAHRKQGDEQ